MPRAASSVGVGRRVSFHSSPNAHATSGSRHRRSQVTLTVTLARLPVLRSFPRIFEEKRDCSQSNPIVSSMVSECVPKNSGKTEGKERAHHQRNVESACNKISDKSPSLSDLRTVALCLLGYAGFFRFSEVCSIRACDIKFFPTYVSIFLESSKTDQFRDGAWVAIAQSNQDTCPVKALEQYIAAAKIDLGEDLQLFRALSSSRSTSKVRCQGLSYSRAREIVKDAF